jgi:hypothetical protein
MMRIESGEISTHTQLKLCSLLEIQNLISLVQYFHVKVFISHFINILSSRMGSKTQHSTANVTT